MAAAKIVECSRPLRSKGKFEQNEKVLCYEPDPQKVKVIYEAKIIGIDIGADERGKRRNEYLVHFNGWNSSWDRHVLEDMLLKDNEENRNLQKDLLKAAEDTTSKTSKKKKGDRRLSDKLRQSLDSSEDWADGSIVEDPEDGEIQFNILRGEREVEEDNTDSLTEPSTSPQKLNFVEEQNTMKSEPVELDEPDDVCTEVLPLQLPEAIQKRLEQDHLLINSKRKLPRLPAQPNIVTLLEMFVRNYAIQKLAQLEKQLAKSPYNQFNKISTDKESDKYDEAVNNINICKEVAEGVRILIDFHLGNILLYRKEEEQFARSSQLKPSLDSSDFGESSSKRLRLEASETQSEGSEVIGKKRTRLSSAMKEEGVKGSSLGSTSSGTTTPTLPSSGPNTQGYPQSSKSHALLEELHAWKLVPETLYLQTPVPASLVYGGVHLTRLLVKLPEIMVKMKFSIKNAKKVIKYLEYLTEFLNNQQDIFSESNYL